jgi:regulator of CtrA degradation
MTNTHTIGLSDAAIARIARFAQSSVFERTFKEGMALVEETAAYLDGPGRAASKRLPRMAALAYAAESMRLTTRLMQVASWLLVQRAVREGDMQIAEAATERYRLSGRPEPSAPQIGGVEELPEGLKALIDQGRTLYDRVRRLDEDMYGADVPENAVGDHLARLRAAFGAGA